MAGDWIKMRSNLWDDPRVGSLVDATETTEATVIGGLYWLWATADQHSEDGYMPNLTLRQIDRKTGIPGLGAALVSIGWLAESEGGVTLVKFDEHNGASAKKRAVTAKRVANHRGGNADVTQPALQGEHVSVTGALAREREEIEEEKRNTNSAPIGAGAAAPLPATRALPENPSDRDMVFALGVPLLTAAGVSEKNARSMLAQLSKQHGEAVVHQAIRTTADNGAGEPVSYLQRVLGKGPQRMNPQEALEASNREVARRWAERNANAAA